MHSSRNSTKNKNLSDPIIKQIQPKMMPSEATGMHYLTAVDQNPSPFAFPDLQYFNNSSFLAAANNFQTPVLNIHDFTAAAPPPPPPSYLSNTSSTSDEAEELGSLIDERKKRRMISNRESARRSRMRKQRQLDELLCQVHRLTAENHGLLDRLNQFSESQEKIAKENARLNGEVSDLRRMLSDRDNNDCGLFDDLPDESSGGSISSTTTASGNI